MKAITKLVATCFIMAQVTQALVKPIAESVRYTNGTSGIAVSATEEAVNFLK